MKKRTRNGLLPHEELRRWAMTFETGSDYFHELDGMGVTVADAEEAWHRLGAAFLGTWQPTPARAEPWALIQFGPPAAIR